MRSSGITAMSKSWAASPGVSTRVNPGGETGRREFVGRSRTSSDSCTIPIDGSGDGRDRRSMSGHALRNVRNEYTPKRPCPDRPAWLRQMIGPRPWPEEVGCGVTTRGRPFLPAGRLFARSGIIAGQSPLLLSPPAERKAKRAHDSYCVAAECGPGRGRDGRDPERPWPSIRRAARGARPGGRQVVPDPVPRHRYEPFPGPGPDQRQGSVQLPGRHRGPGPVHRDRDGQEDRPEAAEGRLLDAGRPARLRGRRAAHRASRRGSRTRSSSSG